MTITADARSSASTAAGPPASSRPSDDATHTDVVSPYGTAPSTPDSPHGGAQTADSRGSEPGAARTSSHTTSSAHRRLPRPRCGHAWSPGSSISSSAHFWWGA